MGISLSLASPELSRYAVDPPADVSSNAFSFLFSYRPKNHIMSVPLPSANPAGHILWRKEAICGYFPAKERQIKVMKKVEVDMPV